MTQSNFFGGAPKWRKSSYSMSDGSCVEVEGSEIGVSVRDSTRPAYSRLAFTAVAWISFVQHLKEAGLQPALQTLHTLTYEAKYSPWFYG
jgi:hypothetical protein